jgi:hypothetical protein
VEAVGAPPLATNLTHGGAILTKGWAGFNTLSRRLPKKIEFFKLA